VVATHLIASWQSAVTRINMRHILMAPSRLGFGALRPFDFHAEREAKTSRHKTDDGELSRPYDPLGDTVEDATRAMIEHRRRELEARAPAPRTPKHKSERRRIPAAETNTLVADYLTKHAKPDPEAVTIRGIARATGCATGAVGGCTAWLAFAAARRKLRTPKPRTVQLTDGLLATTAAFAAAREEMAALAEEQDRDRRADLRRPNQRRS
jgi:hypothetical protein